MEQKDIEQLEFFATKAKEILKERWFSLSYFKKVLKVSEYIFHTLNLYGYITFHNKKQNHFKLVTDTDSRKKNLDMGIEYLKSIKQAHEIKITEVNDVINARVLILGNLDKSK